MKPQKVTAIKLTTPLIPSGSSCTSMSEHQWPSVSAPGDLCTSELKHENDDYITSAVHQRYWL